MNTDTEFLKSIVGEIANKNKGSLPGDTADHRIVLESKRLENAVTVQMLSIDNSTQRDTFYYGTLNKLVQIYDTLFDIYQTDSPNTAVLIELITAIKQVVPNEICPNLKLAKVFIFHQREIISQSWSDHCHVLTQRGVDPKLIDIASIPFKRFITGSEKLKWSDFTWLKGYQSKLKEMDWDNADCNSKTDALISILINCDFNDDRFFIYCKRYIKQRVGQHGTKKKRLAEYTECEKLILEDTHNEFPSYNRRRKNISEKLIDWTRKETDAIKSNESYEDELYKIEYLWDVDTIALFHKYLMDHGVSKKINTELYAKQIAATCSSINKEEFKWETIHKRLYVKDQKSLRRVFEPLLAIVEDIRPLLLR